MEEEAVYIGLSLSEFWALNPKQFAKHCEVFVRKERDKVNLKDRLYHILGQYVGFAVNDPKNYPKKPFLEKNNEEKQMKEKNQSVEEMEKVAMFNTLCMGGVVDDD